MNLNLDSLMGASGLQSSLKWENSKQGFVRKSDGSIYNRTRVTQRVTWTCWSLMVNAGEMKTALVTQSVCQPFIKITLSIFKTRCDAECYRKNKRHTKPAFSTPSASFLLSASTIDSAFLSTCDQKALKLWKVIFSKSLIIVRTKKSFQRKRGENLPRPPEASARHSRRQSCPPQWGLAGPAPSHKYKNKKLQTFFGIGRGSTYTQIQKYKHF